MTSGERGQLLLVGAILIATVVLSSVVLLNSVHDSPTVQTQQDTRSVEGIDRTVGEVTTGLDRLFVANTSNTTTAGPYANASDLTQLVATYERTRLNLSTTDRATALNVTVNATDSAIGTVAIAETPTKIDDTGYNLTGATELPRLSVNASEFNGDGLNVTVANATADRTITLTETGASGAVNCSNGGADSSFVRADFIDGVGTVQTNDTTCTRESFGTGLTGSLNVTIESTDTDNVTATFAITGTGSAVSADAPTTVSNVVVNPTIELRYVTPEVTYERTFRLYDREVSP